MTTTMSPDLLISMTPGERIRVLEALAEFDRSRANMTREIQARLPLMNGTLRDTYPDLSDEEHAALMAALRVLPITDEYTTDAHTIVHTLIRQYENLAGATRATRDSVYYTFATRDHFSPF